MSFQKKARPTPACPCVCDKCDAEAVSIPDSTHRKCPKKDQKGTWRNA